MTGTADVTRYLRRTQSWDAWERLRERLRPAVPGTRFVVLTWRRTGSNLLCGMLHRHPEVTMHNELFNAVDICTYHPCAFRPADPAMNRDAAELWVPTKRDLCPEMFLEHVWSGRDAEGQVIKAAAASCNLTVGFKSFPEHWRDSGNEAVFQERIVRDGSVKKVVLRREDELAVYVSMLRAEKTGFYLTHDYDDVRVHVDPVAFQQFLESYRRAYNRYRSPMENVDTIHITYEQLTNEESADAEYARLCRFLGIADDVPRKTLETTVRQTREGRDLSLAIENYAELEYAFRHTEVKHFRERAALAQRLPLSVRVGQPIETGAEKRHAIGMPSAKWSLLLPICSRIVDFKPAASPGDGPRVPLNRFDAVERMAAHTADNCDDEAACWDRLGKFAESLRNTCTVEELGRTECVVGIDVDDMVFSSGGARKRLLHLLPTSVKVMNIDPNMYGKMCQIWNRLGKSADGDLLLLLGDDVELLDRGWQRKIEARFLETSRLLELPLGAACVALNDVSFPGFSTFPCVHRWHIDRFQQILPRQFVNQGGDPFLFELYSRWDASSFCMDARLRNGIGGDNQARYVKHDINWRGQVLSSNLKMLEMHLHSKPFGICVDIVVPSWRCNVEILRRICRLRGSKQLNVRVWIVVDNPDTALLRAVREMAAEENAKLADGNYYIRVLFNGGGWGASCSRNTGLNYSTADWCLFLDDDVIPSSTLLDAYAGSIVRHPKAKAMVGMICMPEATNLWTEMLETSRVNFFYGVARRRPYPPWGVTANLLVSGGRHQHFVQFSREYPKSGGGEDLDFVFQLKQTVFGQKPSVVAVPGAVAEHPWWNNGRVCYGRIIRWAWGDSLCITRWPRKSFLSAPNWIEFLVALALIGQLTMPRASAVVFLEHVFKTYELYKVSSRGGRLWSLLVSTCSTSIISAQECTRFVAAVRRMSLFSLCRRFDWFDGESADQILHIQMFESFKLALFLGCVSLI